MSATATEHAQIESFEIQSDGEVGQVLAALLLVQQGFERLSKDKRNDAQKYDYVSEAGALEIIRPLLNQHGLILLPAIGKPVITQYEGRSGGTMFQASVHIEYSIAHAPSGQVLRGVVSSSGQGMDSGDKAIYKAITGANKYMLFKLFQIPTGDDPEKKNPRAGRPMNGQAPMRTYSPQGGYGQQQQGYPQQPPQRASPQGYPQQQWNQQPAAPAQPVQQQQGYQQPAQPQPQPAVQRPVPSTEDPGHPDYYAVRRQEIPQAVLDQHPGYFEKHKEANQAIAQAHSQQAAQQHQQIAESAPPSVAQAAAENAAELADVPKPLPAEGEKPKAKPQPVLTTGQLVLLNLRKPQVRGAFIAWMADEPAIDKSAWVACQKEMAVNALGAKPEEFEGEVMAHLQFSQSGENWLHFITFIARK